MERTVISLFSGCGGLDLGFKKAGFKTLLATDSWDKACETIQANKIAEKVIISDIRDISFIEYKNSANVVIGGPPCPPYSQTRHYLTSKKNGFQDENSGYAVSEYLRAVEEINPKVFLFENVDGFMYKTHKDALEFFEESSNALGYNLNYKVVNAANYGVPQTRKRFICVGTKKNLEKFDFPKETHQDPSKMNNGKQGWVTCKQAISEFDSISDEEKEQKPGSKDFEIFKGIPPGDNYLFYTAKRGCKNPKFKWKSRYWTFLLKLSPDRPSWTIQASFSNNQGPFHWKNRFLRIEEIKRLQTFDDDYIIKGDFREQWRQIGNAVPTLLAEIFATKILKDYF